MVKTKKRETLLYLYKTFLTPNNMDQKKKKIPNTVKHNTGVKSLVFYLFQAIHEIMPSF